MARALIITQNYLKENSVVNRNVTMKELTPTIYKVQDLYIKPILGSDLFDELATQINASGVTGLNATLMDEYVLPCMLQYILWKATPVIQYKYMNKGVMKRQSDDSTPADLNEIQFVMDEWKNDAEVYADKLRRYLKAKSNDYPLYYNGNNTIDKEKPIRNTFTGGVFLEKSRWCDDCDCDDCDCCEGY